MKSYPIALDLENQLVVVVGGGRIATRRVHRLKAAQADIVVVAPTATESLTEDAQSGRLQWQRRGYRAGDLDGASLVLAATDDPAVNRRVANTARVAGIPCSVADRHSDGTVTVPAVADFGALKLAIDTGGAGPAISAALRRHLESSMSPGWRRATEIAARLRPRLADVGSAERRAQFWRVFAEDLPDAATGDDAQIQQWLRDLADAASIALPDFDEWWGE